VIALQGPPHGPETLGSADTCACPETQAERPGCGRGRPPACLEMWGAYDLAFERGTEARGGQRCCPPARDQLNESEGGWAKMLVLLSTIN